MRDIKFTIAFSGEELKLIKNFASKKGLNTGTYIRMIALADVKKEGGNF